MRVRPLVLICLMCLSIQAAAQDADSFEQELVQLVNAERARAGLQKLQIDERLTNIALQHSSLMAGKHALSHQFPGEPDVRHRITTTGLRFDFSGENVAYDTDILSAHRSLMNSPPHRANILDANYNVIGVGVVRRGNAIYVTEDFAHRLPAISADQAENAIRRAFDSLRKTSGARPLQLISEPSLRPLACQMASQDQLETDLARDITNVRNVVVWTATEPQKLPSNLRQLAKIQASGWSVGSCFASSKRYPNPVWWNVAITYF